MAVFLATFLCITGPHMAAYGEQVSTPPEFHVEEIQQYLDRMTSREQSSVDFRRIMEALMDGNLTVVMKECWNAVREELIGELETGRILLGQVVVLVMIGAVYSNFSGLFGNAYIGETAFYVVYLLGMTFLATGFVSSLEIASEVTGRFLGFLQTLLPAYFMAAAAAGSALTSAAVCGVTIGAVGMVQSILSALLLPLTRIYMMLVLVGNLYREDMVSRLTELLEKAIVWTMKTLFGVIVGFHVVQGMVLPQADAVKNASAIRLMQMIPGLGAGTGAVAQIFMGTGVLIKNTAGAAAVIVMVVIAAVPVMKLWILMVLYHLAAAVMQPVCDKRLAACMNGAAAGHGLLLKLTGYTLALFAVTIAVLCVATNASWYAG